MSVTLCIHNVTALKLALIKDSRLEMPMIFIAEIGSDITAVISMATAYWLLGTGYCTLLTVICKELKIYDSIHHVRI